MKMIFLFPSNSGLVLKVCLIFFKESLFLNPQIASAIKEVVSQAGSDLTPHILCGDFNSEVTSPGYQLCKEGYLSDSCIQQLQSLENLQFPDGTVRTHSFIKRKVAILNVIDLLGYIIWMDIGYFFSVCIDFNCNLYMFSVMHLFYSNMLYCWDGLFMEIGVKVV